MACGFVDVKQHQECLDSSLAGAQSLSAQFLAVHAERSVQDTETLQATIQLMAPHTNKLTQSQQARLVAAVGAAGAAQQLSDLTLKGTASLLPSAAMLAGAHASRLLLALAVLCMHEC